jgi:hypothetical protein
MTTSAATDRGVAAIDLLSVLYPEPLAVRTRGGREQARAAWTALPSAARPRLLVPVAGRVAATRMMRRQLTGNRLRTRIVRAGLSLAMGSGALMRLPGLRVSVTGLGDVPTVMDPLRPVLGIDDLRLTMPIGPARANRKPVLQVADASGRVLAFVKVGHTPLTDRLVRQEGAVLRELRAVPSRGLRAPRVLASLRWNDHELVVLEPLDIPSRRLTGVEGRRRLLSLVNELGSIGGRSSVEWGHHPYRNVLLDRIGRCGDQAAPLRSHIERVESQVPLSTGSWHGDLNSGNIALVQGACPVWDWERFETGVPIGFDLLHHDLHQSITERGVPAGIAASRLLGAAGRTLAPLGVDPASADAVARTYLVTLACRYLADDQRAAGADLGRVDEWLLPALEGVRS